MTQSKLKRVDPRQIDETVEYDIFKRLPGNRPLIESHVEKLMQAMREHDLYVPILVNQDFEVIDGQHRLEARKRLGIPVPYYWETDLALADIQKLNSTQKAWVSNDYCLAYIELGVKDYETYRWFRKHYSLPHKAALNLLEGGNPTGNVAASERFRNGGFRIRNLEGAKEKAEMLAQIAPYYAGWKDAAFVSAFLVALGRDGFVFKTFIHRVKTNPLMLKPCKTHDQALLMIEDIYNYNAKNKVPLRFAKDAKAVPPIPPPVKPPRPTVEH